MIIVEKSDPTALQNAALLADAQAYQAVIYPPENNFSLGTQALTASDIIFLSAREGDDVLGVGAMKLYADYGEIKSMWTAQAGRGKGIATAVLRALEDEARAEGKTYLRLETGVELEAAVRLYERSGFTRRDAFGDYEENGSSVFMEKALC